MLCALLSSSSTKAAVATVEPAFLDDHWLTGLVAGEIYMVTLDVLRAVLFVRRASSDEIAIDEIASEGTTMTHQDAHVDAESIAV